MNKLTWFAKPCMAPVAGGLLALIAETAFCGSSATNIVLRDRANLLVVRKYTVAAYSVGACDKYLSADDRARATTVLDGSRIPLTRRDSDQRSTIQQVLDAARREGASRASGRPPSPGQCANLVDRMLTALR